MKIISNKRAVLTARVGKATPHTPRFPAAPSNHASPNPVIPTHASGSGDIVVTNINTSPALAELTGCSEQGDEQLEDNR